MVDIQCGTAEIGRGKKKEERKKPQDENITSASATQDGHNEPCHDDNAVKIGTDIGQLLGRIARTTYM